MSEPTVLKVNHENYCEVVFNRPKQLNTFYFREFEQAYTYFKMCESNPDTKFVIFRGLGRAFCAGGDIKNISQAAKRSELNLHCASFNFHHFLYYLGTMSKPVICYMDGLTVGGGTGFAQLSAFKIATENTVVSLPEGQIGHFCDVSNSFNMSRLDGHLGVYLALTGQQIKAEEVLFAGLATHFVHSSELEALGSKLAELPNITLDAIDSAIQEVAVKSDHVLTRENTLFGEKMEIIERCFKYNTVEEIMSALHSENSRFAQSCINSMSVLSPTSLKLTLAILRYATNSTFAECLDYEFRGWRTVPLCHDYNEGVKALFEKRRAKWSPARLEDVDDCESRCFAPIDIAPVHRPDLDFMTSPYEKFLLPKIEEVEMIKVKHNLKSNKQVVDWFVRDRKFKFGVKEKVEDILGRKFTHQKVGSIDDSVVGFAAKL